MQKVEISNSTLISIKVTIPENVRKFKMGEFSHG